MVNLVKFCVYGKTFDGCELGKLQDFRLGRCRLIVAYMVDPKSKNKNNVTDYRPSLWTHSAITAIEKCLNAVGKVA